jgi:two-component system, chemotaxis family, protein-glutamate methylesterase/glutaminase
MIDRRKKIRVLIVDDSALMRKMLTQLLSRDPGIEVVGGCADPYQAREKLVELRPDVMTLDVEMPRMDGATFLEKVMNHFPVRTIVISAVTEAGSELALKMLEMGAVDIIPKPMLNLASDLNAVSSFLCQRVRQAAETRLIPKLASLSHIKQNRLAAGTEASDKVIAIASSTGGTEALKILLAGLPKESPGIVIVQHMPPVFTKTYAQVLARLTPFEVKEAEHGEKVVPGKVLIAPGNFHMELYRSSSTYYVHLHQKPPMHGVRPAADYLMLSAARYAGGNCLGIVLTGMGKDGAEGLAAMKKAGSFNLAQDEATSVVFGMPKEAIDRGAIDEVLPIEKLADGVLRYLRKMQKSSAKAA